MGWPYSSPFRVSSCPTARMVSAVYTVPVGLLGEFTITAWVWGVMACSKAFRLTWKCSVSAGTTTRLPPAALAKGRYSGKKGAMATNSASGVAAKARIMAMRPGAAPQQINRFSGRIPAP
ncbi:unknown [Firmicutes bacterium CAG:137]|nr:unknown [Firmicutes bacterium CAG:137]